MMAVEDRWYVTIIELLILYFQLILPLLAFFELGNLKYKNVLDNQCTVVAQKEE